MQQELIIKIENKVRKLVPRLKELSFGCNIKAGKETYLIISKNKIDDFEEDGVQLLRTSINEYYNENNIEHSADVSEANELEIIGHPIHLENILEAIGKDESRITVAENFDLKQWECNYLDLLNIYNLSLPLSEQTEETLLALDNLLN